MEGMEVVVVEGADKRLRSHNPIFPPHKKTAICGSAQHS